MKTSERLRELSVRGLKMNVGEVRDVLAGLPALLALVAAQHEAIELLQSLSIGGRDRPIDTQYMFETCETAIAAYDAWNDGKDSK